MSSMPSDNPLVQQLQLLLTAYGYNFYNKTNQARADDLLVRERASYFLSHAVELLARLRGEYFTRFVPAPTRENPYPSADAMAQIRAIEAVQQELSSLESHIRGMATPSQDHIWWRFRQEQNLLETLLGFDLTLIRRGEQIYQYVEQLTAESWNQQSSRTLQQMIQQLTSIAQERERFLLLQV